MRWATYREHERPIDALVYFTSCQIATYHYVKSLKRTARSEVTRQRSIAEKMLAACEKYGAEAEAILWLQKELSDPDTR